MYHLISAWEAGTICVFLTHPIWLIKTRFQLQVNVDRVSPSAINENNINSRTSSVMNTLPKATTTSHYSGILQAIRTIIKEEGYIGLVR